MVGDGYEMGVAAEIVKYMLGATEGAFRIDHPGVSERVVRDPFSIEGQEVRT
jgi:hypothetical protein